MFKKLNHLSLRPLPSKPALQSQHDGETVLYYDYYYKKHPMFKNSWSARLIMFTPTQFIWTDQVVNNSVEAKRNFRKGKIDEIKPAAGPQLLPGVAFTIDDKDYIFSHDDPIYVDRLVNFVVNWLGLREFPPFLCYEPQRPVIKLGVSVPGERTDYPEVGYRSDPLFTPSQIALLEGSRIFLQGVLYVEKQLMRVVITNEMFYVFDADGSMTYKFAPHEVDEIRINGKTVPVNSLEYNNNKDLILVLNETENLFIQSCTQSSCQWNGALASFLGIVPSLDCIQNVKEYAEEDKQYNEQFSTVTRETVSISRNPTKITVNSSSDDVYVDDNLTDLRDNLTNVLINDIIDEDNVHNNEAQHKNTTDSSRNEQISDLIDATLTRVPGLQNMPRESFTEKLLKKRAKRQKHKNRIMKEEEEYISEVKLRIDQLNKEFENESSDSLESVEEIPELDANDEQNKMTAYSLSMLTKVLDHAELQNDPELNCFDLIMPYFDKNQENTDYYELTEEASEVRRNILYEYVKQYECDEETFEVFTGYVPEPFGDIFEFIEKIKAIVPINLSPDTIGVAYPGSKFISERANYVRLEIMKAYNQELACYAEFIAFLKLFFDREYDLRKGNDEKYLLVPPETVIEFYPEVVQEKEDLTSTRTSNNSRNTITIFPNKAVAGSPRKEPSSQNDSNSHNSNALSTVESLSKSEEVLDSEKSSSELKSLASEEEIAQPIPLSKVIPYYCESQPAPNRLTAIDVYKILIWYSEQIGQPLAMKLRKLIVQETLLSASTDNIIVQAAAEQVLRDGEIIEEAEINDIIDQISSMNDVQEQKFYKLLDKENSSYYGYNLHIFGANERIRRASQILIQAVITRLEARCLRQFCYFLTGGEEIDLKIDFLEAEKYITITDNLSYSELFIGQHRHHLFKLTQQITTDFATYLAWMSNRLCEKLLIQDSLEKRAESILEVNNSRWTIREDYLMQEYGKDIAFYKRRDFVVERISGSRPDDKLPERQFLLWMGKKVYFCKLLDGAILELCCELLFVRYNSGYQIKKKDEVLLTISATDEVWKVENNNQTFEASRKINLLCIVFALLVDEYDEMVKVAVAPVFFRFLTISCPLYQQGAQMRRQEDMAEHGLLEYCAELVKRPIILVDAEVQECCKVFKDLM